MRQLHFPLRRRQSRDEARATVGDAIHRLGALEAPTVREYEAAARPMHLVFPASRVTPELRALIDQVAAEFGPESV